MTEKIPCTVGILTLNAEDRLFKCLDSLKDFAEVIVFDGNSTDKTLEIARQFENVRIEKQFSTNEPNQKIKDYSEVRNRLIKLASYEWFYNIDSDEMVSKELVEEIREIIMSQSEILIYNVPSKFILDSRVIKYSSGYPGYEIKFFNLKTGAHYAKPVHKVIKFDSEIYKVGFLKSPRYAIFGPEDTDFKIWKNKFSKYIKMEIERTVDRNFIQFLKWRIYHQLKQLIKAIVKISFIYLRHGFKDTLPLKIEFQRVYFILWLTGSYIVNYFKKN